MSTEFGKRLKKARKHAGLTQEALSEKTGIPQSTISTAEREGNGSTSTALFAATCGVSPHWLESGEGEMLGTERTHFSYINIEPAPELRPFRNVPVVGTVQGGEKGFLLELEHATGHGDGFITYPARDQQSYAVRVRGDSMRPRIKAGEFIVVEPNHECQPGDDVVVITKDGQRMVKELLYIRDGEATMGSINNGHANITIALTEIEKMHYVAAIIPRGAFYKPE